MKRLILASLVLALFSTGGISEASQIPAGIRNNNPMCVHSKSGGKWLGQTGKDKRGRAIFKSHKYGLRAGYIVLYTYHNKHKRRTVLKILDKYCNSNREQYARFLCKNMKISPTQEIPLHRLPQLMRCMVRFETGKDPFHEKDYDPKMLLGLN